MAPERANLRAPVGSAVAGSEAFVAEARRVRKLFGGGMRQAGVLAAAALVALEHERARLTEDHARARRLAAELAGIAGLSVDPASVETNMVMVTVDGRCFRCGDAKFHVKGCTYGPFAPNAAGEPYPSQSRTRSDFRLLRELGANLVRVYHPPPLR